MRQGETRPEGRQFRVESERQAAVEHVRVHGEMDLAVVGELDSEMRRAEATDAAAIELDLDQLDFVDASGVRLLLDLDRRSGGKGGRLRIRAASSPQVRRVLELTGVAAVLPIVG
jgi:anti-anti-sigma factor